MYSGHPNEVIHALFVGIAPAMIFQAKIFIFRGNCNFHTMRQAGLSRHELAAPPDTEST
jgi:hypothetical protein